MVVGRSLVVKLSNLVVEIIHAVKKNGLTSCPTDRKKHILSIISDHTVVRTKLNLYVNIIKETHTHHVTPVYIEGYSLSRGILRVIYCCCCCC